MSGLVYDCEVLGFGVLKTLYVTTKKINRFVLFSNNGELKFWNVSHKL